MSDDQSVARRLLSAMCHLASLTANYKNQTLQHVYRISCKAIKEAEQQLAEPPALEFEIKPIIPFPPHAKLCEDEYELEYLGIRFDVRFGWFWEKVEKGTGKQAAHAIAELLGMKAAIKR